MDSINSRIQQFIAMEDITPAKFADTLGIQRSALSHLIAGRNKPSYEVICKILQIFPALSPDWLLVGKGKPYRSSGEESAPLPQFEPEFPNNSPEPDFFDFPLENPVQAAPAANPIEKEEVIIKTVPSEPRENQIKGQRTISHITIFYSDGTFEDR